MTKNTESKLITGANILRAGIFAVGAWLIAWQFFRENWNGPLAFVLGAVSMLILIYISRVTAGKPAPFQLVLRLANDKGGDREDEQTFETLHSIFTQHYSKSGAVRFEGFDTDGSFIWFNFQGPDEASVREVVLSHLKKYHLRHGSYFIANVTQACAAPNDGPTTLLNDLSANERPPTFS